MRRTRVLQIRLTEHQYDSLVLQAGKQKVSDYAREMLFPAAPIPLVGPVLGLPHEHPRNPDAYYHTATSNRLTCLCLTCSSYRKTQDIPLGGFKK